MIDRVSDYLSRSTELRGKSAMLGQEKERNYILLPVTSTFTIRASWWGEFYHIFRTWRHYFSLPMKTLWTYEGNSEGLIHEKLKIGYYRNSVFTRKGSRGGFRLLYESSMGLNGFYSWKSNTKGSSHEKLKIGYFRTLVFKGRGARGKIWPLFYNLHICFYNGSQ